MTRAETKEMEDEEKKKEEMRRTGELSESDSDEDSEEEEKKKKKKKKKQKGDEDEENEDRAGKIWKRVDRAAKQLVRSATLARDRLAADYWTVLCVMYCGGENESEWDGASWTKNTDRSTDLSFYLFLSFVVRFSFDDMKPKPK